MNDVEEASTELRLNVAREKARCDAAVRERANALCAAIEGVAYVAEHEDELLSMAMLNAEDVAHGVLSPPTSHKPSFVVDSEGRNGGSGGGMNWWVFVVRGNEGTTGLNARRN